MVTAPTGYRPRVADMVWLTVARLEQDAGTDTDFAIKDLVNALLADFPATKRETVEAYLSNHCIASVAPGPDTYRMLHRTRRGHVRLYRPGDPVHPGRASGEMHPCRETTPERSWPLLDWTESNRADALIKPPDRMVPFIEHMRSLYDWKSIDPDEFVRQQREGWD